MLQKINLVLFAFFFLLTACSEPEPEPSDPVATPSVDGKMAGKVIWPTAAKVDTTGIRVSSFASAVSIKDGAFVADTISKFSTVFVSKPDGDILMMRYNYPGQLDNDISPQSTALAILMNAPITVSLSDEGELEMIQKIQKDADYHTLVEEVKKAINSGKAINDTTNAALIEATGKLFKSAANLRLTSFEPIPLNIKTANPGTVSFENNDVAHKYVIGVYKKGDPTRLKKLIVAGTQPFASSFFEILNGVFGDGYSTPDQQIFSTTTDGEYIFKIRSGKPGESDGSTEFREAQTQNIAIYIMDLLRKHIPIGDKCTDAGYQTITGTIDGTSALINAKDSGEFARAALDYCRNVLSANEEIFEECSEYKSPYWKNPFISSLTKVFNFFDKASKFGEGMNVTAHALDLYKSRAAIDTCFQVLERKVSTGECCIENPSLLNLLTGGSSKTWYLSDKDGNPGCPNFTGTSITYSIDYTGRTDSNPYCEKRDELHWLYKICGNQIIWTKFTKKIITSKNTTHILGNPKIIISITPNKMSYKSYNDYSKEYYTVYLMSP